jgi:hypothetical protein
MTMKNQLLDEFGKSVMSDVRDDAIDFLEKLIAGKMADATSKDLRRRLPQLEPAGREAIGELLVAAVDATIARMLNYFEENDVEVTIRDAADGSRRDIRKLSDGLVGELYTQDGWIAKFSKYKNRLTV